PARGAPDALVGSARARERRDDRSRAQRLRDRADRVLPGGAATGPAAPRIRRLRPGRRLIELQLVRVCIATDYYYPQLGGITEHVHGQALGLAARGHEVTILTGRLLRTPSTADRNARVLENDAFEVVHM